MLRCIVWLFLSIHTVTMCFFDLYCTCMGVRAKQPLCHTVHVYICVGVCTCFVQHAQAKYTVITNQFIYSAILIA